MAMTVTATMSGAAANEHIYLWIRVLTGATETGGASAAGINAAGGATSGGSLTPNFSSSLPCFALTADNPGAGSFTASANNTMGSSNVDADDWAYGMGSYTGTVAGGTPVTFGGSCSSSDYTTWACYEVPSSGGSTPSVDASSPALASATGAGIKTVTSASFTPPGGSVVVAMICGGGTGSSGSFVMTVTGGGLTWTQRAGNATVTDQDTFVFTSTMPGATANPPPLPQPGSRNWRRLHRHHQMVIQPNLAGLPISAPATLAAAGSIGTTAVQQAGATLGGTGSLAASTGARYITGLGGTGAGYFKDQSGTPRMVLGDAVWALPGNAGRWNSGNWQADFDTYLTSRAAQGFTVVYAKPIGTTQSGNLDDNGKTFDALYPFQGASPTTGVAGANPSTGLTAAFWARIDYFLASAQAKGITVFLNAIGYSSDFDSGPGPLAGKSTTEFTSYGTSMATRYASQPNLVWNLADDYFGDNDTLITAFLTGLTGGGDTHAVSIENMPESDSRNTFDAVASPTAWGTSHAQYNFCYSYNVTYFGIERAYLEASPIPVIQGDGYFYQGDATYQGGSGAFAYDHAIRQDAWHAITSGARGIVHGSESTWQWQSTSLASSGTDWYYANNAGVIRTLMESLPGWHTLIPDTSSVLVTAGRGTHASAFSSGGGGGQYEVAFTDTYVTASRTPDSGSGAALAVIYLSHATTITIDQTKMLSGYTATWADPVTGATSSATAGATYNSTAKGNNSKGEPDWVLILQGPNITAGAATLPGAGAISAPASVTQAGATLSGGGSLTTGATQRAGATLAGAGSLTGGGTQTVPGGAALAGAGSLTGGGTQTVPGGAALAGAGSLAASATEQAPAALTGAGSLAASATEQAPAALTGAGSLTGGGTQTVTGGAALAGAGSLTGGGTQTVPGGAALAGAGSLAASATEQAQAALTGAGSLTTASITTASGMLAGHGSLSVAVTQLAGAALAGAGSITGTGSGAGAGLTAAGSLAASATLLASASLAGAGSVTGAGGVFVPGAAALAGAGSIVASASQMSSATLTGAGSITSPGIQLTPAALAGAGSITASASGILPGAAALTGAGSITANAVQLAGANLPGTGLLTGSASGVLPGAATLSGTGSMTANAVQLASAALAGAGSLTGSASGVLPGAATLTGAGSLSALTALSAPAALLGTGSLLIAATQTAGAALAGTGAVSTTAILRAPATLSGAGALNATGVAAMPGTATLTGTGSLASSGIVSATGTATLNGTGLITTAGRIGGNATLAGAGSLSAVDVQGIAAALAGTGTMTAFGASQAAVIQGFSTSTSVTSSASAVASVSQPGNTPSVTSPASSQSSVS